MIKKFIPAWMVIMEKFYKLVVFNHIYANGDDHLKNFSVIKIGDAYQLVLGYNLMNTPLHIEGDDLGLNGGLSEYTEKSDIYERTGHPCRLFFERFGQLIGLRNKRISAVLDIYKKLPEEAELLISHSFLNNKMKRNYIRIVKE